jgi:hypothetical protein
MRYCDNWTATPDWVTRQRQQGKLTKENVETIRELRDSGMTVKDIASQFPQVSSHTIIDIIYFRTWKCP